MKRARAELFRRCAIMRLREQPELVYFIQCEDEYGPIKIGMTLDLKRRLKTLQAANPYPLRVLTVISGGKLMEEALHRRFAKDRKRGEWFVCSTELRAFIGALLEAQHRPEAA